MVTINDLSIICVLKYKGLNHRQILSDPYNLAPSFSLIYNPRISSRPSKSISNVTYTNIAEISKVTGLSGEKITALKFGKSNAHETLKELDAIEILEILGTSGKHKHFVTKDSVVYAKSIVAAMCGISGEALIERAIMLGIAKYGKQLDLTKLAQVLDNLKKP